jgi:hypothetical protein
MSIAELKAEIVRKLDTIDSEALLEQVNVYLEEVANNPASKEVRVADLANADAIFAEAVGQYDSVLEKLAH